MRNIELKINGMTCNHCVHTILSALRNIGASAIIDLASGTASVEYDESKIAEEQIKAAIEEQGYVCA
nr:MULTISPECIES: cation transporter [unclassified Paenibacillus]